MRFAVETWMKQPLFLKPGRRSFASIMLVSIAGFLVSPVNAQLPAENPWLESSKPLIDGDPIPSESNSWVDRGNTRSKDAIDDSKYPPLDENAALGTEYSVRPSESATAQRTRPANELNAFHYPQVQDYEQVPVYPGNYRRGYSAYNNRQYPPYRGGYQPAYPSGFGSGYNSMGGFPFSRNSGGGFPFSRNSGGGFPFSMGNGLMPFSSQGFW